MQRFLAFFENSRIGSSRSNNPPKTSAKVRYGRTFLILIVCAVWGCGPSLSAPPMFPAEDDADRALEAEVAAGLSEDAPPPLTILPGDMVRLRIMSAEPYEMVELWVDAQGRLHVPFGGDVDVMGLDLTNAETRVEEAIRHYDKYARVSLSIQSFGGHRAIVTGAVDKPGVHEVRPGMRIADVIASAGGTRVLVGNGDATEAADIAAARLIRGGKAIPVSVKQALVGQPLHNVYVRPGDIIYVPWVIGRQIAVLGDVHSARNVPFHSGLRLTEALAAAGGPSRTADLADVRIVRGPLSRAKVYRANLKDVLTGETTDVVLAPGDVVFISEHWFASAAEVINRLTPLLAVATVYSAISR